VAGRAAPENRSLARQTCPASRQIQRAHICRFPSGKPAAPVAGRSLRLPVTLSGGARGDRPIAGFISGRLLARSTTWNRCPRGLRRAVNVGPRRAGVGVAGWVSGRRQRSGQGPDTCPDSGPAEGPGPVEVLQEVPEKVLKTVRFGIEPVARQALPRPRGAAARARMGARRAERKGSGQDRRTGPDRPWSGHPVPSSDWLIGLLDANATVCPRRASIPS
jgi:hypothetical protein